MSTTATSQHRFPFNVSAHAFNADRSQVAVCTGTHLVHIYHCATWECLSTLSQHDETVTGVDWAPKSNRIVTCGQDRNAYVWQQDPVSQQWSPTLVLLRVNRAATCVRWSPNEEKFAVGSGASCVAICYFEQDNDWWVSKQLKKPIQSTVLSVDWHPNSVLLAVGSTDMRAYVVSAFIKGVDKKPAATGWGEKLPFGTVCGAWTSCAGGWIRAVAFSPSGDQLAFAAHDASVSVVSASQPAAVSAVVKSRGLSFKGLVWLDETRMVVVGYDFYPILIQHQQGDWTLVGSMDKTGETADKPALGDSAFNKFRQMDSRAQASQANVTLPSLHQNTISMIRVLDHTASHTLASTSGVDGRLALWTIPSHA